MLLRRAVLEAIRDGRVDLAFRRWKRPRVLAGTRMRTQLGLVEVIDVEVVERGAITEAEARRAGHRSAGELLEMLDSRDEGEIHRVELRWAGADPRVELRERDELSSEELDEIAERLERLDHASRRGPWTRTVLELIRERPEVRAPDLAAVARARHPAVQARRAKAEGARPHGEPRDRLPALAARANGARAPASGAGLAAGGRPARSRSRVFRCHTANNAGAWPNARLGHPLIARRSRESRPGFPSGHR